MTDGTPNIVALLKYYPPSGSSSYSERRPMYASGIADDFMRYIDKGINEGDNMDYMNYVGNGKKSEGVFGKDGVLSAEQKAEMRKRLRATDSVIWDMVISFESKYGDRYMRDTATAHKLLKAQLYHFFKNTGLNPDNTIWYAGLHTNSDNRHIHLCFFEHEPMFLRRGKEDKHFHHGKLMQTGITGLKIAIEQYFSDTIMQLKTDRAELISAVRESVNYDRKIKNMVKKLAAVLPPTGKLAYESENMKPFRQIIDGITEFILIHYKPARDAHLKLNSDLCKRDIEINEYCRAQKIKNIEAYLVKDKVTADLNRRIGNQIIHFALKVLQRQDIENKMKRTNASPAGQKIARRDFLSSLRNCLTLAAIAEEECMRAFEDHMRRLEKASPEPQYQHQNQSGYEM